MAVYLNGELVLYGFVGDSFWREGFTSMEVLQALAEHGSENALTVRINSGGGYAFEGMAIYNALSAHKGEVTVTVDAVAASAASVVMLAGDKIIMRAGSEVMIHDPSGATFGTAEDHTKTAAALDKLADQMGLLYSARSEQSAEEVRQLMKDETWLTAEEAVEAGFADEANEAKAKQASAFDYRIYSHAPDRLVSLSKSKGWSFDQPVNLIAASVASTSQKEKEVADKPEADGGSVNVAEAVAKAQAEAQARIQAILGSDEANGREELAQHFAFKTQMSAEDAIAALATAPSAPGETGGETPEPEAYEAGRMRASGQAQPSAPQKSASASIDRAGIFAARAEKMKGA